MMLHDAKPLSQDTVRELANVHIRNYLAEDLQTRDMELYVADSFLDMYDVDGNLFAYLVPLMNRIYYDRRAGGRL